jgi:hypothetical protein
MIFNNGLNAPSGDFSSVEIISPPILGFNYEFIPGSGYSSAAVSWQYNPQTELFTAGNLSGVFSLGNGNFLATVGPTGNFIEITNTGETVWRYRSPVSGNGILQQGSNLIVAPVFRAEFIANDFSGLQGQNLQANGELEENPQSPSICELLGVGVDEMVEQDEIYLYPNPTQDYLKIVGVEKGESLEIYNSAGVLVHKSKTQGNTYELNICEWASGLYIIRIMNEQIPFIK